MHKRYNTTICLAIILFFSVSPPIYAAQRQYIGDQDPKEFTLGRQGDINDAIATQLSIIPGVFPDDPDKRNQLIWLRYPANNYYFRTAPAADSSFFSNKMEDANASITDGMANWIFQITKFSTLLANNIVLIVFDNYVDKGIFKVIGDVTKSVSNFKEGGLTYLLFIIMLCVLGAFIFRALLRAQIMKALSSVLVAALCLACISAYTANVEKIIPNTMNFINSATGMALMASSYMNEMPVGDEEKEVGDMTGETTWLQLGLINTTNAMWHSLVGAPWANAMFGSGNPNDLKLLPAETKAINTETQQILDIKWWGPDGPIQDVTMPSWMLSNLKSDSYMDTVWLASSNEVKYAMLSAVTNTKERIKSTGKTAVIYTLGQGQTSASYHVMVSMLSVLPALIFLIFVLLVGVPVFIAQFVIIFMLLLLPFALLLGLAGDKGIQATLLYVQKLLGAFAIKIIYGFYLSFVLMFAVAISRIPLMKTSIGLLTFIISVILVFAIKYRKKFFDLIMGVISLDFSAQDYEQRSRGLLSKGMAAMYAYDRLRKTRMGTTVIGAFSGGAADTIMGNSNINPEPQARDISIGGFTQRAKTINSDDAVNHEIDPMPSKNPDGNIINSKTAGTNQILRPKSGDSTKQENEIVAHNTPHQKQYAEIDSFNQDEQYYPELLEQHRESNSDFGNGWEQNNNQYDKDGPNNPEPIDKDDLPRTKLDKPPVKHNINEIRISKHDDQILEQKLSDNQISETKQQQYNVNEMPEPRTPPQE